MKNYEAHKAAKVRGQNAVNAFVNEAVPLILAKVKPFVGTKIRLATGGWAKAFRDALAEIAKEIGERKNLRYRIYDSHGYSLWLEADVCEGVPGDYGCHYMKQSVYLGSFDGLNLKEVNDASERMPKFRTDLTVEGITATLEQVRKLESQISALKSSVSPFGEGLHGN